MSDKIGLVVLGLVTGTLLWPQGACAQGTEVSSVTPGERISFPQPVPRVAATRSGTGLPDTVLIRPDGAPGTGPMVWTLPPIVTISFDDAADLGEPDVIGEPDGKPTVRRAPLVIRRRPPLLGQELLAGFVVPQLPRGRYIAWYAPQGTDPGQSIAVDIVPALTPIGDVFGWRNSTTTVRVGRAGPAAPPPLLSGAGYSLPPLSIALQVDEPPRVLLAPGQPATVVTGADGTASWNVRVSALGQTHLTASASGFAPQGFYLVGGDQTSLDPATDFQFAGFAVANIQGIPIPLTTDPFVIHSRFSVDRLNLVLTSFPQIGPHATLGPHVEFSYTIGQSGGGRGTFSRDTRQFFVPITLRYSPNFTLFGVTVSDPSDVSIVLTTSPVQSTKGVFQLTGSPLAPDGKLVLVGAGVFRGGMFEGRDYKIRLECTFQPATTLIGP